MCRDQNLISETDVRTDVRTYGRTDVRMKIEKSGVGRPPLGLAKKHLYTVKLFMGVDITQFHLLKQKKY